MNPGAQSIRPVNRISRGEWLANYAVFLWVSTASILLICPDVITWTLFRTVPVFWAWVFSAATLTMLTGGFRRSNWKPILVTLLFLGLAARESYHAIRASPKVAKLPAQSFNEASLATVFQAIARKGGDRPRWEFQTVGCPIRNTFVTVQWPAGTSVTEALQRVADACDANFNYRFASHSCCPVTWPDCTEFVMWKRGTVPLAKGFPKTSWHRSDWIAADYLPPLR